MEFDHNNVRQRVVEEEEEDRLSSLPDELIHKILSSFDTKFVVETCLLLSKRWKLLWTSMPCLNFSSEGFGCFDMKFDQFVTHVLTHRNHHIEVSSVTLYFNGAVNEFTVEKVASYAFSHNVQEIDIVFCSDHYAYPPCLFSSHSLKHFTLTCNDMLLWDTTKKPWDFPALTTLSLSSITLWGDVFSNCVNLKNLTLEHFYVVHGPEEVFDIIAPRLSNLMLVSGYRVKNMNLIAPELENLTIIDCKIKYLNAPSGLSSLCYTSRVWYDGVVQFTNDRFHSLNKVTICLPKYCPYKEKYTEEDARQTINMLQELQSARYITLHAGTVECISSFPDLLSQTPSPFSNLICLTIIDSSMKKDDAYIYKAKMTTEARNFFLGNSPNCKLIMELL